MTQTLAALWFLVSAWASLAGEPKLSAAKWGAFTGRCREEVPIRIAAFQPSGLVAMNAVASPAATEPGAANFVQSLWNTPVPYGTLYLLALHRSSGEFRIWPPRIAGPNPGRNTPPPLRRQR